MKLMVLTAYEKEFRKCLENRLPKGIVVTYHGNEKEAIDDIADTDILFCHAASKEFIGKAKRLKWIHSPWIGADTLVNNVPEGVLLTRTTGVNDKDMARYACAYILYFTQRIKERLEYQEKKLWDKLALFEDFSGNNVIVIGLGTIGLQVARSLNELGFKV